MLSPDKLYLLAIVVPLVLTSIIWLIVVVPSIYRAIRR